jgi:site-specific recombinase XerD
MFQSWRHRNDLKAFRAIILNGILPHDLRRTFASEMLDAGTDIATVQKMMGHADLATTARYDRRGEEAKRQAASLLHFPYTRRG